MKQKIDLERTLNQLSNDDKNALEVLFGHFYPRLYRFSKTFLKLEEGIDDVLQEVFIKIWENRRNIRTADTFNAYIFTITRNLLLNELRNRLNNQKFKEKLFEKSVAPEYLLSEHIDYLELKEKVDELVTALPERQREVYLLSRKEGLSYREISQKLSIAEKTVEYHIGAALSSLKKAMKDLGLYSVLYFYLFL